MGNMIFDAFIPNTECYDPPPPDVPDPCTVEAQFRPPEDTNGRQYTLFLNRTTSPEVGQYFRLSETTSSSSLAVFQRLISNEEDRANLLKNEVQFFTNTTLACFKWIRINYPTFVKAEGYGGPDLIPLSEKLVHFFVTGEIEGSDVVKRQELTFILRVIFSYPPPARRWFLDITKELLNPANVSIFTEPMKARIAWFLSQIEVMNNIFETWDSHFVHPALDSQVKNWLSGAFTYLLTGEFHYESPEEKNLQKLYGELDSLVVELRRLFPDHDFGSPSPYSVLKTLLETVRDQPPFFRENPNARARINEILQYLHQATVEHRAELLNLDPQVAFQRSLYFRIQAASELSPENPQGLFYGVREELDRAHLTPDWFFGSDNHVSRLEDILQVLLPHITLLNPDLVLELGEDAIPFVVVNWKGLELAMDALIKNKHVVMGKDFKETHDDHWVQEREFRIGALAVIRYLFGDDLSQTKMIGWWQNKTVELELDLSLPQRERLSAFVKSLEDRIESSLTHTGPVLLFSEIALVGVGIGLTLWGSLEEGNQWNPGDTQDVFQHMVGPLFLGGGATSLGCHFFLQTRNQYISDGSCAALGGIVGFGTSYWTREEIPSPPEIPFLNNNENNENNIPNNTNNTMNNSPSPDDRNPVREWGP